MLRAAVVSRLLWVGSQVCLMYVCLMYVCLMYVCMYVCTYMLRPNSSTHSVLTL